jgi:hypothetical protein
MTLALTVALPAAALAVPASAALQDFRLPAARPQSPSDVQGPVAPDVPASRRLAPTPTPTPTRSPSADRPETPAPMPVEAAPRIVVPDDLRAPPMTGTARPTATVAPSPAGSPPTSETEPAPGPSTFATPSEPPSPPPRALATGDSATAAESGWPWPWLAGGLALLIAALGLAGWFVRRRDRGPARTDAAPQIERPRLAPRDPRPAPNPAHNAEPLQVSLEPLRLSLTLMNATLTWRLELANRGRTPLTGLKIGADMISAHASLSREEQLSGPRGDGAQVQRIERLEPGESRVIAGEFRLPFPQIVPIRQGNTALLLPLARFRVEGDGAGPVVRTFAVGQPGQGSGLQPFRLDQGPRIYPRLAQHAFA